MKRFYAILLSLALAGCSAVPTSVSHDIPNFRPVPGRVGVYRGGQPKSKAGWSKTNAWNEMVASGFRPTLHGLTDFWEDDVH